MSPKRVTTSLVLPPAHILIGRGAVKELTHVEGVLPPEKEGRHTILSLVQGEGTERFFGVAYMDPKSNTRHCFEFLRDYFGSRRGPAMTVSIFSNRSHPFDNCPFTAAFSELNVVSTSTQSGHGPWRIDLDKGTIGKFTYDGSLPKERLSPNGTEEQERHFFIEGPRVTYGWLAQSLIKELCAKRDRMREKGALTKKERQILKGWLSEHITAIRTYSFPEPFRLVADLRDKEKFQNYQRVPHRNNG
jgi:hypothetical protein